MSISHKKINELIVEVVKEFDNFPVGTNRDLLETNRESLIELCQKIYLIESSVSGLSAQSLGDELHKEIMNFSRNLQQDNK